METHTLGAGQYYLFSQHNYSLLIQTQNFLCALFKAYMQGSGFEYSAYEVGHAKRIVNDLYAA